MNSNEIYEKIESIYSTESGRKFIAHLLRSFFPVQKSTYLFFDPEPEENRPLVCCITGTKLMSKGEAIEKHLNGFDQNFKMFLGSVSEQLDENNTGEKTKEYYDTLKKQHDGKVLAVTSTESTKFLCKEALDQLFNFYANNLIRGEKSMKWLSKSITKDEFIKQRKEINKPISPMEENALKKVVNDPKRMTLLDNAVLQNLKNKLDQEEKKD